MAAARKPRQERGEAVVRRVLEVTLRELGRVGLERLAVPEVARKARVNKTSVYRRWPTKEALVTAALARTTSHVDEVPDTGSLEGDLRAMCLRVAAFLASARGKGTLRTVFADGHRLTRLARRGWDEAQQGFPREIIGRAIARGELPAQADAELLMFTLAGALMHRVFIERAKPDAGWVSRLVRLTLRGAQLQG